MNEWPCSALKDFCHQPPKAGQAVNGSSLGLAIPVRWSSNIRFAVPVVIRLKSHFFR